MFKKIYLAGGFHSDWQTEVKKSFSNSLTDHEGYDIHACFYDPKVKTFQQLQQKAEENHKSVFSVSHNYTNWDLEAINKSEIVFAYIEKTNPAVGVIFEVGYSIAKNKKVILIIEEGHELFKDRYFDILREKTFYNCSTLEEGKVALFNLLTLF